MFGIQFFMQEQGLKLNELGNFGGKFKYPLGTDSNGQPAAVPTTGTYVCSIGSDNEGQMFKDGNFSPGGQTIITVRKSVLPHGFLFNDFNSGGPGTFLFLIDNAGRSTPQEIISGGVKDLRNCWQLTVQNPNTGA